MRSSENGAPVKSVGFGPAVQETVSLFGALRLVKCGVPGPAAVPHQSPGPLAEHLPVGLRGHDEERPSRPGTEAQREGRAEALLHLREPVAHLALVRKTAMEVVVDDEALAPVEVGDELVEVGVLGAGQPSARHPCPGLQAVVGVGEHHITPAGGRQMNGESYPSECPERRCVARTVPGCLRTGKQRRQPEVATRRDYHRQFHEITCWNRQKLTHLGDAQYYRIAHYGAVV